MISKIQVYKNKAYEYSGTCYIVTDSENNFSEPIIRSIRSLESTKNEIFNYLINNNVNLCKDIYKLLKSIKNKDLVFYHESNTEDYNREIIRLIEEDIYVRTYKCRFKVGKKNGKDYLIEIISNEQYKRVENELKEAIILTKNL